MLKLIACSLAALALCACATTNGNRAPAQASGSPADAVALRLNALMSINPTSYGLSDAKVVDGRLVAPPGTNVDPDYSKKEWAEGFEDCREAAINQALLDAGMAGQHVSGFRADASHRIYTPHIAAAHPVHDQDMNTNRRGTIRAIVALSTDAGDQVHSYILNDTDNRDCLIDQFESDSLAPMARKDVEKDYLKTEIPKWNADDRAAAVKETKIPDTGATADKDLAAKLVGRLIETACHNDILNQSIELAGAAFRNKYSVEPVMIVDLPAIFKRGQTKKDMSGTIRVDMTDAKGEHGLITAIAFDVNNVDKDNCKENSPMQLTIYQ